MAAAITVRSVAPLALLMVSSCTVHVGRVDPVLQELESVSGKWVRDHRSTFAYILRTAVTSDRYVCQPSVAEVLWGDAPDGRRTIYGAMPHYGLYDGPMHYEIQRADDQWVVRVRIAVEPPTSGEMELPDCELRDRLEGEVLCRGVAYADANSLDGCPGSGEFRAKVTPRNVAEVLRRWSWEAERDYNRDAKAFGIPVTYDFEFVLADPNQKGFQPADLEVPMATTCARTPYFTSFRTGWSLPVVAHEIGHMMGLLDEYEMFSGIVGFYPKTPFEGAQVSRMGLSMRRDTRFLPIHHYLILRRYFCPEPDTRNPYAQSGW